LAHEAIQLQSLNLGEPAVDADVVRGRILTYVSEDSSHSIPLPYYLVTRNPTLRILRCLDTHISKACIVGDIQYGEYVRKKSRRCQNIGPAVNDQKSAIPEAMTLLPCIDSKSDPPPSRFMFLIWTIASGLTKVRVSVASIVDLTE
jgi:hypothetical protein